MPSRSPKQRRTMRAVAHNKKLSKKLHIPQSVARHYVQADKRAHKRQSRRR